MEEIKVDALFLGPQSQNHEFFKEMLNFMMDEHIHWRRNFHPEDNPLITLSRQQAAGFQATLRRTQEALLELSGKLKVSSMPWFSPRYLGHMNADTLMAANLGYMATILYNPNNCAYEGSPATTRLEIEVGKQLARMLGYDPQKAWGHITSGGTVANYEGLWVARNAKSFPLAVREVKPDLVEGLDDWALLNMDTDRTLDLLDQVKTAGVLEAVRKCSVRGTGVQGSQLGKVLVPQSKHYSWTKAVDVLGIGQENMISVKVNENYRMDIGDLERNIDALIKGEKTPVLAVVAVVGTTEEGAVDEVHEIVRLREEYEKRGVSFYLHVDAAYGGYARAIFLDEQGRFMDFDEMKQTLHDQTVLHQEIQWPTRDVYEAYKALPEADSISIDPHKMGYIPYAAGAICMKDKRILDLISYFAAYVFEESEDNPLLLGSYIMEGSKAGASAAAVWTAHRVCPLNVTGYGRIIGPSVEGANRFHNSLVSTESVEVEGRRFRVASLTKPDFNIVDFAFNEEGNASLEAMNDLNHQLYKRCSYKSGPVYREDFITSKTSLSFETYGDAPRMFAAKLGIPDEEWDKIRNVHVLRSCVLTPWLTRDAPFDEYWQNFMNAMKRGLRSVSTSR
jgi:tyrosine decarboxylase